MQAHLHAALVFEHSVEPDPAPDRIELTPLFTDPLRVLMPSFHRFARRESV